MNGIRYSTSVCRLTTEAFPVSDSAPYSSVVFAFYFYSSASRNMSFLTIFSEWLHTITNNRQKWFGVHDYTNTLVVFKMSVTCNELLDFSIFVVRLPNLYRRVNNVMYHTWGESFTFARNSSSIRTRTPLAARAFVTSRQA